MFFRRKRVQIGFEDARQALLGVLGDVGEEFWHGKLDAASADSFETLLGGMGSFNDLVICPQNRHRITDDKEPLANELVRCLTAVCFITSKRGAVTPPDAVAACGTSSLELAGWRCLSCGFSRVSHYNIRAFVAAVAVRAELSENIQGILAFWRDDEDREKLENIADRARASGIEPTLETGWMRPCPRCGTNDTCVFRWSYRNDSFLPASK